MYAYTSKLWHNNWLWTCPVTGGMCCVYVLHGNWFASDHSLLLPLFDADTILRCLNHAATACAVYTFSTVHVVDLRVMYESSPNRTGCHALLSKYFATSVQRPNHIVGNWLPGIFICWHSKLQPGGKAQQITADIHCAATTLKSSWWHLETGTAVLLAVVSGQVQWSGLLSCLWESWYCSAWGHPHWTLWSWTVIACWWSGRPESAAVCQCIALPAP